MTRHIRSAIELFSVLCSARLYSERSEYRRMLPELEARCKTILLANDGRVKNGPTLWELIDGEIVVTQVKDLNFVAMEPVTIDGELTEVLR